MALNIRNAETERLAEALAKLTGESKTEAVTKALRDRLARLLVMTRLTRSATLVSKGSSHACP
jgi:antitoxin VapB